MFHRYQQILDSESKPIQPANHISLNTNSNIGNQMANTGVVPHARSNSKGSRVLARQGSAGYQQHQHYQPHPQHTNNDVEQNSQATERDLERSEFSLQHQNSELDDEESLTFENLNNQSLSVIDEAAAEDSKTDRKEMFAEEQASRCLSDAFANFGQKLRTTFGSSHNESGDPTMKVIIREEQATKQSVLESSLKKTSQILLETSLDNIDDKLSKMKLSPESALSVKQKKLSLGASSEAGVSALSEVGTSRYTIADTSKTLTVTPQGDDPSSNDIGMQRYRGEAGFVEMETAEQQSERIALLDSSEHTTHSINVNHARFNRKLAEIQSVLRAVDGSVSSESEEHRQKKSEAETISEKSESNKRTSFSHGESLEQGQLASQNETITRTSPTEETITCSGTSAALSECSSSLITPDQSTCQGDSTCPQYHQQHYHHQHKSKQQPTSILKHRSSSHRYCYDPDCHQATERHHSGTRRTKTSGVVFASSPPSSSTTGTKKTLEASIQSSPLEVLTSDQQSCARCYHHHYGPRQQQKPKIIASTFYATKPTTVQSVMPVKQVPVQAEVYYYPKPTTQPSYHHHHYYRRSQPKIVPSSSSCRLCHPHYHHHHHQMMMPQQHVPSLSKDNREDYLLDQARARSLTRTIAQAEKQEPESEHANTLPRRKRSETKQEEVERALNNKLTSRLQRDEGDSGDDDRTPTGSTGALTATSSSSRKRRSPCSQHYFTCSYCGETTMPPGMAPVVCHSRHKRKGFHILYLCS